MSSGTALVSNIQKYTIHDGPGIRTEIFFTGCTLRCLWCSNPETIEPRARLGVYPSKCISREKCGWCVAACPIGGAPLVFGDDGVIERVEPSPECRDCFKCADKCPPRALKTWGTRYTVDELLNIVLEDESFYRRSGGGVTLSGGEPIMQWEFARELLRRCRDAGVNTCVETALHVPWDSAAAVFDYTDLVITDVKHMDTEKHREYCGAGNELILANIRKTSERGLPIVVRTPIVPQYNADDANIRATAEFLASLPVAPVAWQLLPYRKMGTEKYDSLGLSYPLGDYEPPPRDEWERNLVRLTEMVRTEYGLSAVAGSSETLAV
ncbi:MAG: glycyl-radical enzyme activating protein [Oscillospiraceae bacterium]|nr:glycyl-radical enzyme activating protein [Oscillospiraceae bacterium]